MSKDFSFIEAINKRYSVRSYDNKPLSKELKDKIAAYADTLSNPFGSSIRVEFIEKDLSPNGEKLGTYGIIKGAQTYIAAIIKPGKMSSVALGYEFEKLILYITSLGLGTCWLGGTFNKNAFLKEITLKDDEVLAVLSPVGFPKEKRSFEKLFRNTIKADRRKAWNKLFFEDSFSKPLLKEEAADYEIPLEMVRIGPSAVNKQPWRIVKSEGIYDFYLSRSLGSSSAAVDMQAIDMGISLCHFQMAAQEMGKTGYFIVNKPEGKLTSPLEYVITWTDMKIRHTAENDFNRVMDIYKQAREFMAKTGNPNQWGPTNWPPEELIKNDILTKRSYVCEHNEKVVGVFYHDFGKTIDSTYDVIEEGNWIGTDYYGVVHRIATDGTVKGAGAFCLNWAFDQCGDLRIDTHPDNKVMQNLLSKLGFTKCGIIHVEEDNFPRYAYEKIDTDKEYLDIVDENGNPTGKIVARSIAHSEGIPHRTSHVWLLRKRDDKVQILLQKRVETKDSFPGCLDISSAGHIPAGDGYEISAIRELKEELGIDADAKDLITCGLRTIIHDDVFNNKPYHDRQITKVFAMWCDLNEDQFKLQAEEVESVIWLNFDQCLEGVKNNTLKHCIVIEELEMVFNKCIL